MTISYPITDACFLDSTIRLRNDVTSDLCFELRLLTNLTHAERVRTKPIKNLVKGGRFYTSKCVCQDLGSAAAYVNKVVQKLLWLQREPCEVL